MNRPPSIDSIRALVQDAIPSIPVDSISSLPTERLRTVFRIRLCDGRSLNLNMAPISQRMLRFEQALVISEACLLTWLNEAVLRRPKVSIEPDIPILIKAGSQSKPLEQTDLSCRDVAVQFLPSLITYSSNPSALGIAFSLLLPTAGVPLSRLSKYLETEQQTTIDFQKGRMLRYFAEFSSPNNTFGPASGVLGQMLAFDEFGGEIKHSTNNTGGLKNWREAFHTLLEGVLRDGEDVAVTMSYELVRKQFSRLGYLLDAVQVSRLVVIDAGDDGNILVSTSSNPIVQRGSRQVMLSNQSSSRTPDITVEGLCDWSNAIFGDPLFATVFSHNPSSSFLCGFGHPDSMQPLWPGASISDIDIVEDCQHAHIRLLLYECYHATVIIVQQFYRPGTGGFDKEIAARRRLMVALAKLERFDDTTGKRTSKAA
ncbi:hypothetical protein F5Y15DRAFT_130611 [Xylariaceae sp. FL0016]|nr:hypothetical protein F5Y15DRAFT_130611 [Xylariaceae sp. FL0016]